MMKRTLLALFVLSLTNAVFADNIKESSSSVNKNYADGFVWKMVKYFPNDNENAFDNFDSFCALTPHEGLAKSISIINEAFLFDLDKLNSKCVSESKRVIEKSNDSLISKTSCTQIEKMGQILFVEDLNENWDRQTNFVKLNVELKLAYNYTDLGKKEINKKVGFLFKLDTKDDKPISCQLIPGKYTLSKDDLTRYKIVNIK